MKRYEAAGGRYYVCPICFNAKQLDEHTLIAGAELQGTVPMWAWIGDEARHHLQLLTTKPLWAQTLSRLHCPHRGRPRGRWRAYSGMGDCCGHEGYENTFGSWFSRRVARRYRRRGLDKTAERMVAFISEQGVSGASVLEIGGGVGGIQVELLRRGAARTTNLELVGSYEADALALAGAAGGTDRMTRVRSTSLSVPRRSSPTT